MNRELHTPPPATDPPSPRPTRLPPQQLFTALPPPVMAEDLKQWLWDTYHFFPLLQLQGTFPNQVTDARVAMVEEKKNPFEAETFMAAGFQLQNGLWVEWKVTRLRCVIELYWDVLVTGHSFAHHRPLEMVMDEIRDEIEASGITAWVDPLCVRRAVGCVVFSLQRLIPMVLDPEFQLRCRDQEVRFELPELVEFVTNDWEVHQ